MSNIERLIRNQHPLIPTVTLCRLAGLSYSALRMRVVARSGKLSESEENALTDTLKGLGIYPDALNGWIGGEE
jgi:hypothetical protein